jgi:hypothetical protein
LDLGVAAERRADRLDRRVPVALGVDELGDVVHQPEPIQRIRVEGEDDDRAAGHAAQLAPARGDVPPLVDGHHGHGGID